MQYSDLTIIKWEPRIYHLGLGQFRWNKNTHFSAKAWNQIVDIYNGLIKQFSLSLAPVNKIRESTLPSISDCEILREAVNSIDYEDGSIPLVDPIGNTEQHAYPSHYMSAKFIYQLRRRISKEAFSWYLVIHKTDESNIDLYKYIKAALDVAIKYGCVAFGGFVNGYHLPISYDLESTLLALVSMYFNTPGEDKPILKVATYLKGKDTRITSAIVRDNKYYDYPYEPLKYFKEEETKEKEETEEKELTDPKDKVKLSDIATANEYENSSNETYIINDFIETGWPQLDYGDDYIIRWVAILKDIKRLLTLEKLSVTSKGITTFSYNLFDRVKYNYFSFDSMICQDYWKMGVVPAGIGTMQAPLFVGYVRQKSASEYVAGIKESITEKLIELKKKKKVKTAYNKTKITAAIIEFEKLYYELLKLLPQTYDYIWAEEGIDIGEIRDPMFFVGHHLSTYRELEEKIDNIDQTNLIVTYQATITPENKLLGILKRYEHWLCLYGAIPSFNYMPDNVSFKVGYHDYTPKSLFALPDEDPLAIALLKKYTVPYWYHTYKYRYKNITPNEGIPTYVLDDIIPSAEFLKEYMPIYLCSNDKIVESDEFMAKVSNRLDSFSLGIGPFWTENTMLKTIGFGDSDNLGRKYPRIPFYPGYFTKS